MTLWQGDCLELMKNIPDGSVDLTVTSPPYDHLRTYHGVGQQWCFERFQPIARELYRVTTDGGVVVWIVNDSTIDGSETGTSFRQALYFKDLGFNLHDTMIWRKSSLYQDKNRYINDFEYMFVFSKGKPKTADLLCDRPNKHAGRKSTYTERQKDDRIIISSAMKHGRKTKNFGVRFNVWDIVPCNSNTERTGHPAQFPERLVQDHILTWSKPGDMVLDPFMGSGTTGVVCFNTERDFIGIEICEQYFQIAKDRIAAVEPQLRLEG